MRFLEYVEPKYQSVDSQNYLVLSQNAPLHLIDYGCKMVELNQIAGLLPMYVKQMNDQVSFYYDISGKNRLSDCLGRNQYSERQGGKILFHLAESLKNLSQYFLKAEFCILDIHYIFINDALDVFIPLLPIQELQGKENDMQVFFQKLVSNYFVTDEDNLFYDGLLKYLTRPDFQLNEFIKRVQPEKTAPSKPKEEENTPLLSENLPPSPVPLPKEIPGKSWFSKPNKEKQMENSQNLSMPLEMQGIKIPGSETNTTQPEKPKKEKHSFFGKHSEKPSPPSKEEKKKNKEKKGFHLFGGGKKEVSSKALSQPGTPKNEIRQNTNPLPPQPYQKPVENISYDDVTTMQDDILLQKDRAYFIYDNQRITIYKTPFTIGRAENADYRIAKNQNGVSRNHATITEKDGVYYIKDENSKYHTYLNGNQLVTYTNYPLEDGSHVRLGMEEFVFHR